MIEHIFPEPVLVEFFKDHNKYEKSLTNKCYELEKKTPKGGDGWLSKNTYNTMDSFDLTKDKDFDPITNFIKEQVEVYCTSVGIDVKSIQTTPHLPWFNIYRKGDFQEFHHHSNTALSAVYFLSGNAEKGAKLFLKKSLNDMLSPMISNINWQTIDRLFYKPEPGKVVIFRGHMEHAVEQHEDDIPRISLAYNFYTRPIQGQGKAPAL
jgi:uncharacterized protein (TIGR02466 family)